MKNKKLLASTLALMSITAAASITATYFITKGSNKKTIESNNINGNQTIDKIQYIDSEIDNIILNKYPEFKRSIDSGILTTKDNKENLIDYIKQKNELKSYSEIKGFWNLLRNLHKSNGEFITQDLLEEKLINEKFSSFKLSKILINNNSNFFDINFSMELELKSEAKSKSYLFSYKNIDLFKEITPEQSVVLESSLNTHQVFTKTSKEYDDLIKEIKLDKDSLQEIKDQYSGNPIELLKLISEKTGYRNLDSIIKQNPELNLDINNLEIKKWNSIENGNIELIDSLDNLKTNFLNEGNYSNNKIALKLNIYIEKDGQREQKNIIIAFDVNIDQQQFEKEVDSIKESILNSTDKVVTEDTSKNMNYKIEIDNYDEIVKKINDEDAATLLVDLFKSKEISDKFEITSTMYKWYDRTEAEISKEQVESIPINQPSEFNEDGYIIDFLFKQDNYNSLISIYINTTEVDNKISQDQYWNILSKRIDNFNLQLFGEENANKIREEQEKILLQEIELNTNKEKLTSLTNGTEEYNKINNLIKENENNIKESEKNIREISSSNPLFVESHIEKFVEITAKLKDAVNYKDYSQKDSEKDTKNNIYKLLSFIFSNLEEEEYRNFVPAQEIPYVTNYNNEEENKWNELTYQENFNWSSGLINSNVGNKKFNFPLLNSDIFVEEDSEGKRFDNLKVSINIIKKEESKQSSKIWNENNYSVDKDIVSEIHVNWKYKDKKKKIIIPYICAALEDMPNLVRYNILSDALKNSNKEKVSYDTSNNSINIKTSAENFLEYKKAVKDLLEIKDKSRNNPEALRLNLKVIKALNKTLGHSVDKVTSGIRPLESYFYEPTLFNKDEKGNIEKKKIEEIEKIINEQEDWKDYSFSTLFAGGRTGFNDFFWWINWTIEK